MHPDGPVAVAVMALEATTSIESKGVSHPAYRRLEPLQSVGERAAQRPACREPPARTEAELQAEGKPEAAEAWLRARDLVYDGTLEAPKGETPEDWEPVELPLFRSTGSQSSGVSPLGASSTPS